MLNLAYRGEKETEATKLFRVTVVVSEAQNLFKIDLKKEEKARKKEQEKVEEEEKKRAEKRAKAAEKKLEAEAQAKDEAQSDDKEVPRKKFRRRRR